MAVRTIFAVKSETFETHQTIESNNILVVKYGYQFHMLIVYVVRNQNITNDLTIRGTKSYADYDDFD